MLRAVDQRFNASGMARKCSLGASDKVHAERLVSATHHKQS